LLISHAERGLLAVRLQVLARLHHRCEEFANVLTHQFFTPFGAVAFDVRAPQWRLGHLFHRRERLVGHVLEVVLLRQLRSGDRATGQRSDHERSDVVGIALGKHHVGSRSRRHPVEDRWCDTEAIDQHMKILGLLDRENLVAEVDPRPTHVRSVPDDHLEIRRCCGHVAGEPTEPLTLAHATMASTRSRSWPRL